jgi:hypothetical protein
MWPRQPRDRLQSACGGTAPCAATASVRLQPALHVRPPPSSSPARPPTPPPPPLLVPLQRPTGSSPAASSARRPGACRCCGWITGARATCEHRRGSAGWPGSAEPSASVCSAPGGGAWAARGRAPQRSRSCPPPLDYLALQPPPRSPLLGLVRRSSRPPRLPPRRTADQATVARLGACAAVATASRAAGRSSRARSSSEKLPGGGRGNGREGLGRGECGVQGEHGHGGHRRGLRTARRPCRLGTACRGPASARCRGPT